MVLLLEYNIFVLFPPLPPRLSAIKGGEGGWATGAVSGSERCRPCSSELIMHFREESHRGGALRTSAGHPEKPIVQPWGFGTRWRPPLEPNTLSGPGKHSHHFRIRFRHRWLPGGWKRYWTIISGLVWLTLRCSNRHPIVGGSAKGYKRYPPSMGGAGPFPRQLHW